MERKKKSTKKSTAPKLKDLDVKQRRLALIKQKQCDAVALHIVTKLIDFAVEEDVFLQSLKYLNQCHYQDIVEERAITKLCGYPICPNMIPDMPTKKYHISTKSNKVYDISERKNYCSNFCYKAGIHIKDQMLTSPLWFRDKEEIPEFYLLSKDENGVPGIEIDQGIVKLDADEIKSFTSVADFTQESMEDIPENLYEKLNVNCEKSENVETEQNKQNHSIKMSKEEEKDFNCFASMYTPNLADILKENAEYFTHFKCEQSENKTESFNNKVNPEKPVENETAQNKIKKTDNEAYEITENIKIGFDKTIINKSFVSENDQKIKGILSKERKIDKTKKKRVSFHDINDVKEIEKIDYNAYKKEQKKNNAVPVKYKNVNVIGSVQEKSNIYIYQTAKITENKISEELIKIENSNNETKNDASVGNNLIQNEFNEVDINKKQNKLNKLKNSAAYKRANRLSKSGLIQKPNDSYDIKLKLNKCVEEWFTLDTFIFLYGEEYVKKIISEKSFKQYLNRKKNLELDEKKQKQYEEMCKRLNLFELADKKYDESVTGKKLKPLPKYEDLQKDAETMDLRVQAFYSGCYEVYDDDYESETESVKDEDEPYIVKGAPAVLPLIDSKDISAMRKKIFLTSLNRIISTICEILKQSPNYLLSDMKQLIDTFEFTAKNIVFKTGEWQLVIVLLTKILAIRDKELQKAMESNETTVYINSLGEQFNIKEQNVNDFLINKCDLDIIFDKCIKKNINE